MKRVSALSTAAADQRDFVAAVACQGVRPGFGGEIEQKVKVLDECVKKVSFQLKTKGTDAEIIAARACGGAVDADETVACMDKAGREFRSAKDTLAETLAATACARGNPADETAACIDQVRFRVGSSDIMSDMIAAIACGR